MGEGVGGGEQEDSFPPPLYPLPLREGRVLAVRMERM